MIYRRKPNTINVDQTSLLVAFSLSKIMITITKMTVNTVMNACAATRESILLFIIGGTTQIYPPEIPFAIGQPEPKKTIRKD
jgi:hypothetical protein